MSYRRKSTKKLLKKAKHKLQGKQLFQRGRSTERYNGIQCVYRNCMTERTKIKEENKIGGTRNVEKLKHIHIEFV